ncbi:MAG: NAD(P)-binding domain-containing protein [Deltaproteobacteria bacterium]|nr:NAD(P)-binding domain-containing protein [Deltaproteobacteria bacterium]MBT6490277.1 NAD(P)-binding domain-containing protein [Deltaproteobacteria bacterium]
MSEFVLPISLDWLIIGGGIHGVHIAASLIGEAGVAAEKVCIVDPAARLLDRWRSCTDTTGMTHLRSPSVHHLDIDPWSLQHFARKGKRRKRGLLVGQYGRPALTLFNSHCDKVVETFGLSELHIQDRAVTIRVECDGVRVELASGSELIARNLVLAIGAGDQPNWPEWAPQDHDCVHHIFEPGFDAWPTEPETVAVVGGGISSAQVSIRLVEEGHKVYLISRHSLREHIFDSDPGWLGPRNMHGFRRVRDFNRRRVLIDDARHRGSMPPGVRHAVRRAMMNKQLRWHEDVVESIDIQDNNLKLKLGTQEHLEVHRVLLATGFSSKRPGGALVDGLIASSSLPCAECGYPVVDTDLRWHPNVYVSGPLAELELGPVSRNIAGARRAATRLVDSLRTARA